jgi:hypothetical protein
MRDRMQERTHHYSLYGYYLLQACNHERALHLSMHDLHAWLINGKSDIGEVQSDGRFYKHL